MLSGFCYNFLAWFAFSISMCFSFLSWCVWLFCEMRFFCQYFVNLSVCGCFVSMFFVSICLFSMDTNSALLLAELYLYSYEAHFIQGLFKKNEKKLARWFNLTFHYADDVLSLKKHKETDRDDRLMLKFYDKDKFDFPIVNFSFICINIQTAYMEYLYQLIRYSRVCGSYHDFLEGCCEQGNYRIKGSL